MSEYAPPIFQPTRPGGVQFHRLTVDRYEEAIAAGIYPPQLNAELIGGFIIEKMPIGNPHAYATRGLRDLLYSAAASHYVIGSQEPVVLSDTSRPEPDAWLATPPKSRYAKRAPRPGDLTLVCEVSDSSLAFDRGDKLSMYAVAGVPEYWIVNLADRRVEVHVDPLPDGTYAAKRVFREGETLPHGTLGELDFGALFPQA